MESKIKIPVAIQLRVDDVGWHNGRDERYKNRSSRSGLPRNHHPDDYLVLNEIGKALNMKICCALVLGEWDKDNILRGEPHVTYDVDGWDMASKIDMDYAQRCFENLEGSEYLDYTVHGLLHGNYDNGILINEMQYYPYEYDKGKNTYIQGRYCLLSNDEFDRQLELFCKIYNSWEFRKKLKSFAAPGGTHGTPEENAGYAQVLKKYGLYYWQNGWRSFEGNVAVTNGVICMKALKFVPWDAYDVDPEYLKLTVKENEEYPMADFGTHWTNFLRWNPENDFKYVPAWIEYFKKHAEIFGVMLSKDIAFAASQVLYNRYAKLDADDCECTIDLSEVDNKNAIGLKNEFYISFKNDVMPKECFGGNISLYDTRKEFKTYKIERSGGSLIKIVFI
jgi:hypothetical protein